MKVLFHIVIAFVIGAMALYVYLNHWSDIHYALFGIESDYQIYVGDQAIRVTLADTPEERRQGLSGVRELGELEGKIFLFEESGQHGIWMKDMNFSIDVVWINDDLEIVYIAQNISPDTFPEVFGPPVPARYVLEVNAFFADSYKLKVGDRINLPSDLIPSDINQKLLESK